MSDKETGALEDKEDFFHTDRNVSDGDEEDEINNEYESEHSELPIDVFVPALQLERKFRSLDEGDKDDDFFLELVKLGKPVRGSKSRRETRGEGRSVNPQGGIRLSRILIKRLALNFYDIV